MTLERHFGSFYDSLNRSLTIIVILTLSDPFWPSLTLLKQIYTHFQFFFVHFERFEASWCLY